MNNQTTATVSRLATKSPPPSPLAIPAALEHLDQSLEQAEKAMASLEDRLATVLDVVEQGAPDRVPLPIPRSVADQIRSHTERVNELRSRVNLLLQRLQV